MRQDTALEILKTGVNVFLTGSAGAGKTYTLTRYLDYLKDNKIKGSKLAITASTGIAATHINGNTIHSWACIGIKDQLSDKDLLDISRKRRQAVEKIQNAQILIIDEISMLHRKQFELVDRALSFFRHDSRPFGGMQVIVVGDFYQLPPVSKNDVPETNNNRFCFMGDAWVRADFKVCYLTEQHRSGDDSLNRVLNAVRDCNIGQEHLDILMARKVDPVQHQDMLHLYTHNADVDFINFKKLKEIDAESYHYMAINEGNEKVLEILKKSVLAPQKLELKVGAKVMFVKNNQDEGYANGTQGEIVKFIKDEESDPPFLPVIQTKAGATIIAKWESWQFLENDTVIAEIRQLPLRLAWAITIHKSQGMTLDEAKINLGRTFEAGQGYVAISRLRSINGLHLEDIGETALLLNSLAIKANARFMALSEDYEQQFMAGKKQLISDMQNAFLKQIKRL